MIIEGKLVSDIFQEKGGKMSSAMSNVPGIQGLVHETETVIFSDITDEEKMIFDEMHRIAIDAERFDSMDS
jgi:hypothetical protein